MSTTSWNEYQLLFREALLDGFSIRDLPSLLLYHCESRAIERITNPRERLTTQIDDILNDAVRQGWLEILAKGAIADNPTNVALGKVACVIIEQVQTHGQAWYQLKEQSETRDEQPNHDGGTTYYITNITMGNITNSTGIAIGEGASANVSTTANKHHTHSQIPLKTVALFNGVEIGFRPITSNLYAQFLDANADHPAPRTTSWSGREPLPGALDEPVVGVNHDDTLQFCQWLTQKIGRPCRLPTVEEWNTVVERTLIDVETDLLEWTGTAANERPTARQKQLLCQVKAAEDRNSVTTHSIPYTAKSHGSNFTFRVVITE